MSAPTYISLIWINRRPKKKAPATVLAAGALGAVKTVVSYIVSMKLRSLSLRLGCLSLRKALASI